MTARKSLPADLAVAHALILAERAARLDAEAKLVKARAEAANAQADLSNTEALISWTPPETGAAQRFVIPCCEAWEVERHAGAARFLGC